MHDPKTVAFEIKNPFVRKDKHGYKPRLITIWHNDPEKDGTDDSCGWFLRTRHVDPAIVEKVRDEFAFNFKHNYWFNEACYPRFSTMGVVLEMYTKAAWVIFMHMNNGRPDRKRHKKFMNRYLFEILHFAENPTDSIGDSVTSKYGIERKEEMLSSFVSIITSDIMRKLQKWYQHPRWHIHHWSIQFHPLQKLKRRYWDKCCICNKRGFKGSAMGDWSGDRIWHQECDNSRIKPAPRQAII